MEPLITLFERAPAPTETLPAALAAMYGGGLALPEAGPGGRPYVVANFVASLDGVVSYELPGRSGGGPISGGSEADRAVMGLVRALADVVIFGSGSLHEDKGHLRTPAYIYPPLAEAYAALRAQRGRAPLPTSVVLTASGNIDLDEPTFHTPGLRAIIATTAVGAATLAARPVPPDVAVWTIPTASDGGLAPARLLERLASERGVRVALHEGGPSSLAPFIAENLLDEQFLTLSPTLVGRAPGVPRLALVEHLAYLPAAAPWLSLLSVRLAESHLFLRYHFLRKL